jgi:DNA-binding transcriptional LysR family regulator
LTAAANELDGFRHGPAGLLRIVVQPPVASFLMGPLLARFLAEYPRIRLDISVVKMPANIISEGFDAGIRIGEQVERDMVAMRVMGEARFVVVASPEYLARHSVPRTPQDLQDHNCIRNRLPNGAIFGWDFKKKGRPLHARIEGTLIVDDIDLSIHAVLDGVGVAYLLYDYIAPHIASGRLVPLLDGYSPRLSGFFLYHSNRRQVTAPLRALIHFLKTETKRRGLSPASPLGSGIYPNYRLVGPARR